MLEVFHAGEVQRTVQQTTATHDGDRDEEVYTRTHTWRSMPYESRDMSYSSHLQLSSQSWAPQVGCWRRSHRNNGLTEHGCSSAAAAEPASLEGWQSTSLKSATVYLPHSFIHIRLLVCMTHRNKLTDRRTELLTATAVRLYHIISSYHIFICSNVHEKKQMPTCSSWARQTRLLRSTYCRL